MYIYVIRHGETDWNIEEKIQGNTDIELNRNGIEQAKRIKKIIDKYNIDIIISSPLKRAKKTAEIINESIHCNIICSEALRERSYGEFEGMRKEDFANDEIMKSDILNNYYANKQYKGIETVQDLCNRVRTLIDELKIKYNNENILLVTHGGTIRAINTYFKGINKDGSIGNPETKNCEIITYIC